MGNSLALEFIYLRPALDAPVRDTRGHKKGYRGSREQYVCLKKWPLISYLKKVILAPVKKRPYTFLDGLSLNK